MTSSSLAVAALVTLLSGQASPDRQAFAEYSRQLNAILAAESPASASGASVASAAPTAFAATATCLLAPGSGNAATTRDCTACHANHQGSHSHPVDVYQDAVRSSSLRTSAEVVRRGVFLADGKVSCLSCHDGNSTWKFKLALPPDAKLREPVKPGNAATYDPAQMAPSRLAGLTATTGRQVLPAGTEVSPTPLCKACHAFD
ncbi:MAG TPA: hypothetical protein VFM45_12850 [Anaeromyxobacteraceae bacterium]|nr:hypothetical protein [Anaeromyxobacteraceae bacterium]